MSEVLVFMALLTVVTSNVVAMMAVRKIGESRQRITPPAQKSLRRGRR